MTFPIAIWLIILGLASNEPDSNVFVTNTLSTLCPYMDYCERNATKPLNAIADKYMPCCSPCSCEDDCVAFENCCPDKNVTNLHATPMKCATTVAKTISSIAAATQDHYRIVDWCPVDERNLTLSQKCRGENRTNINDYQWVSDIVTGKTFQNHHCSSCHGVDQIKVWDIKTSCTEALFSDFKSIGGLLTRTDSCAIINSVPDSLKEIIQKYRCSVKGNSQCKELGTNTTLVDACDSLSVPYYFGRKNMYKNIYCFICSNSVLTAIEVCEKPSLKDSKTSSSFSIVLRGQSPRDEDDIQIQPYQCDIDSIFDVRVVCL